MKKKKTPLNERDLRKVEILSKYHKVDNEKQTVDVDLHFEDSKELCNEHLSTKEKPCLNKDLLESTSELIDYLPEGYGVNINVNIKDYSSYAPNQLLESFKDMYELENYKAYKQKRYVWLLATILTLIGVGLLIALYVLETKTIGGEIGNSIVNYIIDTAACVFIWEAISQLYLYPADYVVRDDKIAKSFKQISFKDKKGKIVASGDQKYLLKDSVIESKRQKEGKIFLLITGASLIFLGTVALVSMLITLDFFNLTVPQLTIFIITIFIFLINIFAGIGAISRYRNKGPFKNIGLPFSIIVIISYLATLVICVINMTQKGVADVANVFSIVLGLVATILYLLGFIYTRKKKKK